MFPKCFPSFLPVCVKAMDAGFTDASFFVDTLFNTHLELLDSSLQAFVVQADLFGGQLVLCRLEPPVDGAREAAELEQLLLAGLNGSKPV